MALGTDRRRDAWSAAAGWWIFLGTLLLLQSGTQNVRAAEAHAATTSRSAQASAVRAMPLDKISPADREKVRQVINSTTMYRRLPVQVINCDPQLYQFLIENPEVIVNIWDVMGVSDVSMVRTGPNKFRASDGEGTRAELETLYSAHDRHLVYAEGSYDGPLFRRPVTARCVMLLRSACLRETDGRFYVTAALDTFVKIDRYGPEVLAKTFQPWVGKVADHNFTETMSFVTKLSQAAEQKPDGIERLTQKLTGVQPDVRAKFIEISARMSSDYYHEQMRQKSRVARSE